MKLKTALLAIGIASGLAACQSNYISSTSSQHAMKKDEQHILQGYTWSYQPSHSSKPVILSFDQSRLGINAGCNVMGTEYQIENQQIVTGHVISTMMACNSELMKQEAFFGSLFQQQKINFQLDQNDANQPKLTITDKNGQHYTFLGKATPEMQYQSKADVIFLEIQPKTVACTGVAPQQCLQVREITYSEQGLKTKVGEWQNFYDTIDGYTHQDNQRTILRVKRFERKNVAADQSKYAYVKDMVVEQELVN